MAKRKFSLPIPIKVKKTVQKQGPTVRVWPNNYKRLKKLAITEKWEKPNDVLKRLLDFCDEHKHEYIKFVLRTTDRSKC